MSRLRMGMSMAILGLWAVIALRASFDPRLVALASVVTPVAVPAAGWLFASEFLKARKGKTNGHE